MTRLSLVLIAALCIGLTGCEQSTLQTDDNTAQALAPSNIVVPAVIDDTLNALIAEGKVVGISALVYEGDTEVYHGAFGMADREANIPMTRDTVVQIYSMTKAVTGVALMMMHEDGYFDLDDPIGKHIPELANLKVFEGEDASGNPILVTPNRAPTVRDFMMHTAGLSDEGDPSYAGQVYAKMDPENRNNTLTEFAEKLGQVPLKYHPGTQWRYSSAMDMQALMVERFSGQPYDEFVQTRILDPLKMVDTGYQYKPGHKARRAAIYQTSEDGALTPMPDEIFEYNSQKWPLTKGSWGLVSTLDDYMQFARMLQGDGTLGDTQLLKQETVTLMRTNYLPDSVTERHWLPGKGQVGFGLNMAVRTAPPKDAAEHYGVVGEFFWDGWPSTLFWVDPQNDLTAVMFVQILPFSQEVHNRFRDAVYNVDEANFPVVGK